MAARTITKEFDKDLILDTAKFREGICMTVMNVKLNVGNFNINVNIGKRIKRQKDMSLLSIKHRKEMKKIMEETKAMSQDVVKFNIY
mgnify:CR=1 FL=1